MRIMSEQTFDISDILQRYPARESSLVMVLQDIQDRLNYLPESTIRDTATALNVPLAKVHSVATFYKAFSLTPRGRRIIKVCKGTACHVRGAQQVQDEITRLLGIKNGETTEDMEYTLEVVNCLGACAMAPVVVVGDQLHGGVQPGDVKKILEKK